MTALQKIYHLTEQEYLALELDADMRHEYIDGQLYAMAGASERHNLFFSFVRRLVVGIVGYS